MSARRASLQSMTGYGRATRQTPVGSVTVELRSTNHRYLEVEPRLPNGLTALQGRLTELIRRGVRRGRLEVSVALHAARVDERRVTVDERLLERYHDALRAVQRRLRVKGPVTLDHLLTLPQALTISEGRVPVERLQEPILVTAQAALEELVRSRRREGSRLVRDVRAQLRAIERHTRAVRRRLPVALAAQRRRLRQRLQELVGPGSALSPSQLEQAAAIAKEADIHEELVRLESHLAYVRQTLSGEALVGKRLDFIAQELMREANTMGAKVNDAQAAQHVVDLKGCIEKIREQVQNLE